MCDSVQVLAGKSAHMGIVQFIYHVPRARRPALQRMQSLLFPVIREAVAGGKVWELGDGTYDPQLPCPVGLSVVHSFRHLEKD